MHRTVSVLRRPHLASYAYINTNRTNAHIHTTPSNSSKDSKSSKMADNNAPSGSTGRVTATPTSTKHENAGAEALRKAYAKYNVHPTISNPGAAHHNDGQQAPTNDAAKDAKDTTAGKTGGEETK